MAKKPPGPNRPVNGDVSVDLRDFLTRLARALDWEGVADAPFGQPGSYCDVVWGSDTPDRQAVNYLFSEIMSKFDDKSVESDKEKTQKALAKFREAEDVCTVANAWFYNHAALANERWPPPDCDPDVWQALLLAKRKIAKWLGPFDWNEGAAGFRFTHGASFGMPRTRSTPAHKYSGKLEITHNAEPLARAAMQLYPAWGGRSADEAPIKVVDGNRVLCVPKSYKVHRVIAAEPSGNMFFQKGIGLALRRRLKAIGVDLRSQTMNRDFAYFGSVTGAVATIDLSMASDTVSKGIVDWAIPPDWVEAMGYCRSPFGKLPDGSKVLYRKWSSMGNAYTFELETMLFYGIARACAVLSGCDERFVTCYGDDIIAPSRAGDLLIRTLRRCGFVPNEKKSFVSGPFRESCGSHYLSGQDVTPFYIRSQPRKLTELFLLVNNLRRWNWRMRGVLPEHQYLAVEALVKRMRSYAPSKWRRPRIPDNVGDGAFIGTFDECLPRRPRGKWLWWEGWQVEVIANAPKRIVRAEESRDLTIGGVIAAMVENLELGPPSNDDWRSVDELHELSDASGGVLPNRSKRYIITTQIVTQF